MLPSVVNASTQNKDGVCQISPTCTTNRLTLHRNCDHQISTTIRAIDDTVVDADHRGGWTQILRGRTS